jgi:S-adenosylmethionine decarboxylase
MTTYTPGLHLLATFAAPVPQLSDVVGCRVFFDAQIHQLGLSKVGETYHRLPNHGGFTAMVALPKSHLCLHTWPEHGLATVDVFLAGTGGDASFAARALYAATLRYFQGTEQSLTEVWQ